MSNNYMASQYHKIPEAVIQKICPAEFAAWEAALGACAEANSVEVDDIFQDFAVQHERNDSDYSFPDKMAGVDKALQALTAAFHAKTGGLHIGPAFVGDGLPGSTVSEEGFWYVGNALILNPAFDKLADEHGFRIKPDWFMDCEQ